MHHQVVRNERGQTLTLFALVLVVLLLAAGLVIDSGFALAQQRTAQNAADFSAMAGTRVLSELYTGTPVGAGTDANVLAAVNSVLSANRSQLEKANYVDVTGKLLGGVGSGIPAGAAGVVVNAKTAWRPFFLGIIGVNQWSAGAGATALTQPFATGGVLPIAIQDTSLANIPYCDPSAADFDSCLIAANLEPGSLLTPGGFGWLKFGAQGKCSGFGLGMDPTAGCASSQGFLQNEVGPPANSYGCCTKLGDTPDAARRIGSLTGNKPVDLTYYVVNKIPIWVPIFDTPACCGANASYHIVGFAQIIITGFDTQHAKWLTGVKVSTTYGDTPNAPGLGVTGEVQLIH